MWNIEAEDLLISLVRNKPLIYSSSQREHKDRIYVENAFKEMSEVMCQELGPHFCLWGFFIKFKSKNNI